MNTNNDSNGLSLSVENNPIFSKIFSLEGKIALITGGGSGIGFDIAQCMIAAGATVIITGRREFALQESIKTLGKNAHYIVNDVTELKKLEA